MSYLNDKFGWGPSNPGVLRHAVAETVCLKLQVDRLLVSHYCDTPTTFASHTAQAAAHLKLPASS